MHDFISILKVLAPFILSYMTFWLSNKTTAKRNSKKDDRDYVLKENHALSHENKELRAENERLRKELDKK